MTSAALKVSCDLCRKHFHKIVILKTFKLYSSNTESDEKIKCDICTEIYEKNLNCLIKCAFCQVQFNIIDWKHQKISKNDLQNKYRLQSLLLEKQFSLIKDK